MDGLQVTPASFIDAMALQQEVARALKSSPIDIDANMDIDNISNNNIETIIKAALSLVTSDKVLDALFKCAEKALYHKEKIDRDFFENVDNRELFYPVMIEVAKVNLAPFFKSLGGTLSKLTETIKSGDQK